MTKSFDEKVAEWLDQHTTYPAGEVYEQWKSGRLMSKGQERELAKAIAFSKGEPPPKKGAQPGNSNAMRGPEKSDSEVHFRCTPTQKALWVKAASASGMKLKDWIIKKLGEP